MSREEERATGARLHYPLDRAARHGLNPVVSCLIWLTWEGISLNQRTPSPPGPGEGPLLPL